MNTRRTGSFWLFTGPALAGFICFSLWPMLYSLWLSFCQDEVITPVRFIGVQNYLYLFTHDPSFWPSVKVTLIFTAVQVPLAIVAALALALLLNQPVRARGFWRAIYFVPSILPQAAYAVIFGYIFQADGGLLNRLLALGGIHGPAWSTSPTWALPVLIAMSLWSFGYPMVIFLGGLQTVPRELHEAAHMDGAGAWARFRLPDGSSPTPSIRGPPRSPRARAPRWFARCPPARPRSAWRRSCRGARARSSARSGRAGKETPTPSPRCRRSTRRTCCPRTVPSTARPSQRPAAVRTRPRARPAGLEV